MVSKRVRSLSMEVEVSDVSNMLGHSFLYMLLGVSDVFLSSCKTGGLINNNFLAAFRKERAA